MEAILVGAVICMGVMALALIRLACSVTRLKREAEQRQRALDGTINSVVNALETMRLEVGKCFTYGDMCKELDRAIAEYDGQCRKG